MKKREIIDWVKEAVNIPSVLVFSTYFWQPKAKARLRRENEERQIESVKDFLVRFGFSVSDTGEGVVGVSEKLEVSFSYYESCKNCYKVFEVKKDGKKVTIRELYYYLYEYLLKIAKVVEA